MYVLMTAVGNISSTLLSFWQRLFFYLGSFKAKWGKQKKKRKKEERENNQAHLTIKSNVWKTAASLAQKASTSAANSRVKHVAMHFISIYVTAQEPCPK